jgi:erythronate-4-phosphate dehydrogenase
MASYFMKIFFDENMPYAAEFFAEFGQLIPFSGRRISAEAVAQADVLLVRSITKVNPELLAQNNKIRFVGTATIGLDHIDQGYLKSRDIAFSSAPGCNAVSVAEYVISALTVMSERYLFSLTNLTVGIVGAGNTGTQLSNKLQALGVNYKLYDPPLVAVGDQRRFCHWHDILACDVISLHVPLTKTGKYPSFHLIDQQTLKQLSGQQILINACRGEVVDNHALLALKQQGLGPKLIWDVWENEPEILTDLIAYTEIATAHIAGYSLEGKSAGTEMLYQALCQYLDVQPSKCLSDFLPSPVIEQVTLHTTEQENHRLNTVKALIKLVYDVRRDDAIFRQQFAEHKHLSISDIAQQFDFIRKNYPTRREFSSVKVELLKNTKFDVPHQLGFSIPSKKGEEHGTKI